MTRRLSEHGLFFREFLRTFHTTGAILPSGRLLARALSRYAAVPGPPRRILEVGPGTGAVTRRLARTMGPDDRLDLIELNERFVERLRAGLADDPRLRPFAQRIRVVQGAVEDLPDEPKYDLIVSGLPLNNFTGPEVERILGRLTSLLAPGGVLSFFEYIGVRAVRMRMGRRSERERLRAVDRAVRAVLDPGRIRRESVWLNVPPAWVHHVRPGGEDAETAGGRR